MGQGTPGCDLEGLWRQVISLQLLGDPPGFAAAVEHTDTGATDQVVDSFPHQILTDGRPHLTEGGAAPVSRVHTGAPQFRKGAGVGFESAEIELFFGIETADSGSDASVPE